MEDYNKSRVNWSYPNDTNLIYSCGAMPHSFDFNVNSAPTASYTTGSIGSANNAPGCPSLTFVLGLFQQQHISADNVTAMLCVQGLEDIDALTTFLLPDMRIDPRNPPVVDEASARWVASEGFVGTGFPVRIFDHDPAFGTDGAFLETVVHGTDGVRFDELVGEAHQGRLIGATTDVDRKYMAQVISENMRVPYEGDVTAPSYRAYLPDVRDKVRLVQDKTSKIVLRCLLGAMVACAVVVYANSWGLRRVVAEVSVEHGGCDGVVGGWGVGGEKGHARRGGVYGG